MKINIAGDKLKVEYASGASRVFDFPAVAVSIGGKRIEAATLSAPVQRIAENTFIAEFADENCSFKVTVTPGAGEWFFKQLELTSSEELPTPDYVEVDHQQQYVPGFKRCGYMSTSGKGINFASDEEGRGERAGCGYPLLGGDLFTGLEHPAAFNTIVSAQGDHYEWNLRHFPIWENRRITSVRAVIGSGGDLRELFFDYLASVRLPVQKKPLFSFCTFWSDPYMGNMEYEVTEENYRSMFEAFRKLDLQPDVYTLDAGWQERNSILRAKDVYGGEAGLKALAQKLRAANSDLSLWVSPNGNIGIAADHLRSNGFAVGSGMSAHYSGDNFGVLMDKKLEKALTERITELASSEYGVCHFKVDWDNECAVSPEYKELYPTRDHVREASLDVMARINAAARSVNDRVLTRNGRWPSPWYLSTTSHISLPDTGDCEYASFPALSQRDAAANHRDMMYWVLLVRDGSICPLDVFDNHEFAHSIRNPFQESPGVWSNTCVWAIMRGTSYHQLALMPEALEDYQVNILRRTMEVLRKHPEDMITDRSHMIGGNPAAGEIYGFFHPGTGGDFILALRNSSPLPQEYTLPDLAAFYEQYYPDCRIFSAGEKIIFSPHEVKVLSSRRRLSGKLPQLPCQLTPRADGSYDCYLVASAKPDVLKIHQIDKLELINKTLENNGETAELDLGMKVPWRMRDFKLLFRVKGEPSQSVKTVELRTSRFAGCSSSFYTVPVAEIPYGTPGAGEVKNPVDIADGQSRYFAAELPQGGEVFCRLIFSGAQVRTEDLEVWVSGFEAPARTPETAEVRFEQELCLPLPHPEGFPVSLRIE